MNYKGKLLCASLAGGQHKAKLWTLGDPDFNPGHWARASASLKTLSKELADKLRATEGADRHPLPSQNCNKERNGGKAGGKEEEGRRE